MQKSSSIWKTLLTIVLNLLFLGFAAVAVFGNNVFPFFHAIQNIVYFFYPFNAILTVVALIVVASGALPEEKHPKRYAGKTVPVTCDILTIVIFITGGWFGYAAIQISQTYLEHHLYDSKK